MLAFVDQYADLQETRPSSRNDADRSPTRCFWRELEAKEARDKEFQAAATIKPDSTDTTPCEINGWPADETLIEDLVFSELILARHPVKTWCLASFTVSRSIVPTRG